MTRDAEPTIAVLEADITICADSIELKSNKAIIGTGTWSSTDNDIIFTDITDSTAMVSGLKIGANTIIWTISNGVCNSSSDTIIVTQDEKPTIAMAGADQILCADFTTTLGANTPSVGSGLWTLISANGNILDPTNPNTTVDGMIVGDNIFVWTISNGTCDVSQDTVVITISDNPTADVGPDQTVFKDDGVSLSVISDANGQAGTSYLWESPLFTANIEDPTSPTGVTQAFPTEATEFSVTVTSDLGCVGRDTLFVTVKTELTLSSAFTPNGDGMNDLWLIKNLDDPSIISHSITIHDGFGSEVLSSSNFKGWDGTYNGESLPVGSYYYVLETVGIDGEKTIETGIVSILK